MTSSRSASADGDRYDPRHWQRNPRELNDLPSRGSQQAPTNAGRNGDDTRHAGLGVVVILISLAVGMHCRHLLSIDSESVGSSSRWQTGG
jgi:hypothetical protein